MASKLKIDRGTRYVITFNYERDGAAADLTGATVRFTVKSVESDTSSDDSTALIKKDVTSHTDPTAGQTEISLSPTDTQVDPGDYYYDIKVDEDSDGLNVYKAAEGRVIIDGSPTNRTS